MPRRKSAAPRPSRNGSRTSTSPIRSTVDHQLQQGGAALHPRLPRARPREPLPDPAQAHLGRPGSSRPSPTSTSPRAGRSAPAPTSWFRPDQPAGNLRPPRRLVGRQDRLPGPAGAQAHHPRAGVERRRDGPAAHRQPGRWRPPAADRHVRGRPGAERQAQLVERRKARTGALPTAATTRWCSTQMKAPWNDVNLR